MGTSPNDVKIVKGRLVIIPIGYARNTTASVAVSNGKNEIPFFINPESISESLQGGWVKKIVPGQSNPVSSWTGNGPRTISLSLLVTKDASLIDNTFTPDNYKRPGEPEGVLNQVWGRISSTISKVKLDIEPNTPKFDFNNVPSEFRGTSQDTSNSLDISKYLDSIRELRNSELFKRGFYSTPPSLVQVDFGSSIGFNKKFSQAYWVVESIEISETKFSNDLSPMEAEVKLTLTQFSDVNVNRAF